jgi:hypothetical protein
VHAPLSHTWSGPEQAWATGAPIIADTANSVPTAAKSEVMVRDVDRISRLFALLESAIRFPPALLVAFRRAAGHRIMGCELAQSVSIALRQFPERSPQLVNRSPSAHDHRAQQEKFRFEQTTPHTIQRRP